VETGVPQHLEYYYPYEGFNRWFACTFVKLNDGVVATNLDITKRKQAEEERFRHFALLQQSEEVAGMGSWDYNVTTGAFLWSDGMYRLFGLPLGTPVAPRFYLDVVEADDRPIAERLVHKILQEPSRFEEQLRVRVGGQVKTLRLKAEVLRDATGQPARVLGVDLDISAVQRLEADNLRLRLSQQQTLFEAVQQAQETERKRIAEGLHNGVGQLLFATKLRLDRLHTPVLDTEPGLVAARQEADRLLVEAIRQTRTLSHELVPTVLEDFGLTKALQDICRQLSTPQLVLRCHVVLDEQVPALPTLLQLALYRMAQELGLNIVKHAHGATEASLELETTPGFVLLRAEDNGAGFASDVATSMGLGLRTIRDQVALLDGTLELGHEPEFGTFVRLRIPLPGMAKAM
jgi:signal transduction histidine kinase